MGDREADRKVSFRRAPRRPLAVAAMAGVLLAGSGCAGDVSGLWGGVVLGPGVMVMSFELPPGDGEHVGEGAWASFLGCPSSLCYPSGGIVGTATVTGGQVSMAFRLCGPAEPLPCAGEPNGWFEGGGLDRDGDGVADLLAGELTGADGSDGTKPFTFFRDPGAA